ncbi:hypothetical protein BDV96DRAFT_607435 [Lophiotrema nucula]|uniref:DnaJ domain-containing protein n=1 Tax=Lophiotrema nucula TaxID=690887 RepID=A0A6A5YGI0_9PLEO|nr:hypothetical protein BDV96DRAFT_607435 [Lophiotrema nucula]
MGAGQSSGGSTNAAATGAEVKTSYYELLGLERTATEDDIKKAYRRKALELHPDRNYGDVERATALFAEIQTAYQVLSDPQERAWYDAHEGDILRGGDGGGEDHFEHNMKVTTASDIARMMGKFRSNVEFSDSPTGFYGFLRELFETLAKEEEYAADWENVDVPNYPTFGHKDDTYEDVVRTFYAGWSGFATRKTFAWKDKYRVSEAPDRRVRRLIEKENKRFRDEGIREFNDAVRDLVLFVRKRDPRYTPNTQTEEDRAKAQRAANKAQAQRARAAQAAKLQEAAVPAWATARDAEELEEEEEEIEEEHFECVACHKTFKSEKQWEAHEKSKKHQKAVSALKRKMRKENAHLDLDDDAPSSGAFTPIDDPGASDADYASGLEGSVDDIANEVKGMEVEDDISDADEQVEGDVRQPARKDEQSENEQSDGKVEHALTPETASGTESDDEYASRSDIEARLAAFRTNTEPATVIDDPLNDLDSTTNDAPAEAKLGKAAQKRAKKAAKAAEQSNTDLPHKCARCGSGFPSKTQLFQHIKDLDHAAPVSETKGKGGGGGKKKGKK